MPQFATLADVTNTCVPYAIMQRLNIDDDSNPVFVAALEAANVHIKAITSIAPSLDEHPSQSLLKHCTCLIAAYYLITPERLSTLEDTQIKKLRDGFNDAIELLRSIPTTAGGSSKRTTTVPILDIITY
jgi:hypothetical protein